MEQHKIDRINHLTKKHKEEGLTPAEHEERKALREEYVAGFRNSLTQHLDNTYIVDEDGTKRKLEKKDEE